MKSGWYLILLVLSGVLFANPLFAGEKQSTARIYGDLARSLSQMDCPEYSSADEEIFRNDFQLVWQEEFYTTDLWVAALKHKVFKLSDGRVSVAEAESIDFPYQVKGPAVYLRVLHKDGRSMKVIVGPYKTPVMCFE